MPSYDELDDEIWWRAEHEPANLQVLTSALRAFYHVGPGAIGAKGDNNHTSGYHRSRNWILNSAYCTNRTYSVSRTAGDRSGGNGDWICAVDIGVPPDVLIPMCQRLDVAVRSGRLEKITEWYGNADGDSRVDGYDNIANRVTSSDSSHLWHLHISFDRGRANEDHSDLLAILTGGPFMALTDLEQDDLYRRVCNLDHFIFKGNAKGLETIDDLKFGLGEGATVPPQPYELSRKLNQLLARPPVQAPPVDQAAIDAAVLAAMTNPAVLAAIAAAVRPVVDGELDEAFAGGVDQD